LAGVAKISGELEFQARRIDALTARIDGLQVQQPITKRRNAGKTAPRQAQILELMGRWPGRRYTYAKLAYQIGGGCSVSAIRNACLKLATAGKLIVGKELLVAGSRRMWKTVVRLSSDGL